MLRDTHKGMETMSMVSSAVKDERWADADRGLHELHNLITDLMRQVGDKQRDAAKAAKSAAAPNARFAATRTFAAVEQGSGRNVSIAVE